MLRMSPPKTINEAHRSSLTATRVFLSAVVFALLLTSGSLGAGLQFRGVWVNAWGSGLKSAQQVHEMVSATGAAGANALLVQVRKRGDAYYASSIEPRASGLPEDFDPLQEVLDQAHRRGMQVHAWFVVYPAASGAEAVLPSNHVLRLHPDWVTYSSQGTRMAKGEAEGLYLDPGLPEVQEYIVSVVRDLVSRYDLDGLHLDYVRYPSRRWGYHPESVRRFIEETGADPWKDESAWDNWRRGQVTQLVARIRREVSGVRPAMRLSAAVFADQYDAFKNRLQDWEGWLRAGLVDFVVPMNYAANRSLFASRSKLAYARNARDRVYMGVGVWNKPASSAIAQMKLLKALRVPGIVIYHYGAADQAFWRQVGSEVFGVGKGKD